MSYNSPQPQTNNQGGIYPAQLPSQSPPAGYYGGPPPPPQGGYYGGPPPPPQGGYYGGPPPPPQGGYYGGPPPPPPQQGSYYGGPPPPPPPPPPPGAYYNQQQQPYYTQDYPSEPPGATDDHSRFVFTEKSVRLAFIRKVYSILACQMVVTIGIMCIFIFVPPVRRFGEHYPWLMYVAIGITFGLMIALCCCVNIRRKFPLNIILLAIFTMVEAFMLGMISIRTRTIFVLYAAAITLAIVVAITIFAFQTKIDFTYLVGFMIIVGVVLMAFGIMLIFIRSKLLRLVYCSIGVLFFSMFLLIDTQMMMGGKHQFSFSPEDYVFAALSLYIDIVQIFMMVLGIFSSTE